MFLVGVPIAKLLLASPENIRDRKRRILNVGIASRRGLIFNMSVHSLTEGVTKEAHVFA